MNRRISLLVAGGLFLAMSPAAREADAQRTASVRVPVADVFAGAARLDFVPRGAAAGFLLTVSGPDGSVEQQNHDAGRAIFFTVAGPDGRTRPDGVYTYELRAKRSAPTAFAGKPSGIETPDGRAAEVESSVKSQPATESAPLTGSFWIQNGQIIAGNETEPRASRAASAGGAAGRTSAAGRTALDVVTADDAIIQGSLCVGLDCVNNEAFGFNTIRLKENNTRIAFVDTSTGVGFATNDWLIQANGSGGGAASYFGILDQGATGGEAGAEAGTLIFQVTAGAPANSLVVDSTGRVGFRTATPVLDLHVNTTNTPALRLDQNNGGGFVAQAWDVGGNEANFFVRDVTGGSRLPFRIRPGAPTSSIDISGNGDVGVGTPSPAGKLDVRGQISAGNGTITNVVSFTADGGAFGTFSNHPLQLFANSAESMRIGANGSVGIGTTTPTSALEVRGAITASNGTINNVVSFTAGGGAFGTFSNHPLLLFVNSGQAMTILQNGYVGIGTGSPGFPLQMASGAYVSAGGAWTNASSREYKRSIQDLSLETAEETLLGLTPVTYEYRSAPGEHHVGFIAEDVPEIVATPDRKGLSSMDIVGVLTKVVQEQQKTIRDLSERLARVEAAGR